MLLGTLKLETVSVTGLLGTRSNCRLSVPGTSDSDYEGLDMARELTVLTGFLSAPGCTVLWVSAGCTHFAQPSSLKDTLSRHTPGQLI